MARSSSTRRGRCARRSTADTAAVSDDLLMRLKAHVGDTLRLGGQDFRIAGAAGHPNPTA